MAVVEQQGTKSQSPTLPLRLLVVTRKYWPVVDEACMRLMHWIDHWKSLGVEVQIVTARWNKAWPTQANLRGVQVHRLVPPPNSQWNEGAFQRSLAAWIQKHAASFDAVYFDAADGLLATFIAKCKNLQLPVIARVPSDFQLSARPRGFGAMTPSVDNALRQCHALVTPSTNTSRLLAEQGIRPSNISVIPDLVSLRIHRSKEDREFAGHALFHASSDLVIPGFTDLAIHFGDSSFPLLQPVLKSTCDLLDRGHPIRLWLVGIRQDASQIYEWIKLRGWHREILLFDGFDVLDDLVQAADLAIVSNPDQSLQYSTNLLLQAAVPTIVAETSATVEWMPSTPLLKTYYSAESLTTQLHDWIGHRNQWGNEAIGLRNFFQRHYPFEHALDRWREVFINITARQRGNL
jgi:hypothetical protein